MSFIYIALTLATVGLLQLPCNATAVKKTTPKAVKIAYVASGFYPDGSVAGWGLNSYRAVQLGVQHAKKNKWAGKDYELELPEDLVFQANGTNSTQLIDFIRYAVQSEVVAILGADWSRLSIAVLTELNNLGSKVPLISAGATSPLLSNSTTWPNFFRTIYTDHDAILSVLPVLRSQWKSQTRASTPPSWAVLYSQESFGQGGHDTIQTDALSRREVFLDRGFPSGTSQENITTLVASLLSSSTFSTQRPIIFITATGPDTSTVLKALDSNNVHGAPRGDWIIGSNEAPGSTVHSSSDIEKAAGYQSYLPTQQNAADSRIYAAFERDFQAEFQGQLPTGGYAASAYDSVVLTAAALKATAAKSQIDLRKTIRRLRIQGLGVPIVFPSGINQPVGFPLDLLRLNPPANSSATPTTTIVSQINKKNLYPKYAVGTPLPKTILKSA